MSAILRFLLAFGLGALAAILIVDWEINWSANTHRSLSVPFDRHVVCSDGYRP